MRRLILIFFIFLVLGIGVALLFRDDNGYLMVAFAGRQLETSLALAVAALLVAIWALITVWRLLVAGAMLPGAVGRWRRRRRGRKARKSLYAGLIKYAEGDWKLAESRIQRLVNRHEAPGLNYLYAAQAAQHQGHSGDRDRYLEKAAASPGMSELAVLLTQARLQLAQGQHTEASASLARLHELAPQHPYVLELYGEHCARTGDFARLRMLLPTLYKHTDLSRDRIDRLALMAWEDAFARAGDEADALTEVWKQMPKHLRRKPAVAATYARCLHAAGADAQAAKLIRSMLKQQWDPTLALLFGDLQTDDETSRLND